MKTYVLINRHVVKEELRIMRSGEHPAVWERYLSEIPLSHRNMFLVFTISVSKSELVKELYE